MQGIYLKRCLGILLFLSMVSALSAASGRYRCMWRDDPATTMVVGWDQLSGADPVLYYDTRDHGREVSAYPRYQRPSRRSDARGMDSHFVRLSGLLPNTVYYFVISDSEGVSRRLSFRTAPADPSVRLSIIAGGDSRNYRDGRRNANRIVSKLRPHFVLFGGDFTGGDTAPEWHEWFDDWQESFGSDGRIFPIVVARGNHEYANSTLLELFDAPGAPGLYYGLTFGGNLLRVYTLNSLIASGGEQRQWLESDLRRHAHIAWKIAQYHHPMRPHTQRKTEKDELVHNWASLFYQYEVRLAIECDAHVVKSTWPVRPSVEPGSYEGFIRDDADGTVYIGEGGWGAPLREANDRKPWTRDTDSFNQVKWLLVDRDGIEARTVKTDGAHGIAEVDPANIYRPPLGLVLWSPPNGDVIRISKPSAPPLVVASNTRPQAPASQGGPAAPANLMPNQVTGDLQFVYQLPATANVTLRLLSHTQQQVYRADYPGQSPGRYFQTINIKQIPRGDYQLLIETEDRLLEKYQVLKRF